MIRCAVDVDIYDENSQIGTLRVDSLAVRSGEVLLSTKKYGTRLFATECRCGHSKTVHWKVVDRYLLNAAGRCVVEFDARWVAWMEEVP